jgi:hypothetical protein
MARKSYKLKPSSGTLRLPSFANRKGYSLESWPLIPFEKGPKIELWLDSEQIGLQL